MITETQIKVLRNAMYHCTSTDLFRWGLITRKQYRKRKTRVRRTWRKIAIESLKQ